MASLAESKFDRSLIESTRRKIKLGFAICVLGLAGQAAAQISFYEGEGFRGRVFSARDEVANFDLPALTIERCRSLLSAVRGRFAMMRTFAAIAKFCVAAAMIHSP